MEPWRPRHSLACDAHSHHTPRRWTTPQQGQRRQSESHQTADNTFAYHDLGIRATRRRDTHPDRVDHVHTGPHERSDHWSHAKADTQQEAWPAGPFPEA